MSEQIRSAGPDDLAHVEGLLGRAALPAGGVADQFGDAYVVAEADGRVVGAAGVEVYGRFGLLRSVVVDPEWRGRGLGERLARERLAWARGRGIQAVYLLTTTAEGFFPRVGFRPTDRAEVPAEVLASPEFASICPSTAAVMSVDFGGDG